MNHDSTREKEIAEAFGVKESDVLTILAELEKKGVVTSFLDSETKK
jgi:DNA-binding MarR family transcriptional regulator